MLLSTEPWVQETFEYMGIYINPYDQIDEAKAAKLQEKIFAGLQTGAITFEDSIRLDTITSYRTALVYLNRVHEVELARQGLIDFSDFIDLKYDVDSQGETYPDVYSEFEKGVENDKKKKGGKGGKILPGEIKK